MLRAFLLVVFFAVPAFGQRDLKDIPVPDPELERKSFQVAEGFEVNLYAADPSMHKPIQMNFDPQGRLWIASSEVYPHIAPGQEPTDKVLILEDADGDGVAEKTTVFADGLLIPTGVLPGDGGVYVANSTEILHLKDTDGDGKADQTRVVLSGFGTEDTHHIIHTFRWGPDGLMYFNQSIYIHSHIETPFGVKRLNAGGIWQFRPETMELNVFARGWVNTWGHQFDKWGTSFVTDGAGGEGINYLVPGAAYPTAYGVSRILHGLNPGSPKYCGLEIVDGRHLPDDWQGNLITHDFRGHRVCRFTLTEDGSGFSALQQPDLIKTPHVAFRPIDVAQGPDGAIYIADWYNPIIQHGEVDFRDPRRDHTHGRIWRVTAKGRPLVERPKLVGATVKHLLDQLDSQESQTRLQAKRVLKELGDERVLEELRERCEYHADRYVDRWLLEALWMSQAFDAADPQLLTNLLASQNHNIRAAAVRQIPHWKSRAGMEDALKWLETSVADDHPRVRLEAVCALRAFASAEAAEIALRASDLPLDTFLDYALWQTVRELQPYWLPLVKEGKLDFGGQVNRLLFAVRAAETPEAVPILVQCLKDGRATPEQEPQLLQAIGTLGGPNELRLVFDLAVDEKTSPDRADDLMRALLDAKRRRNVQPAGDLVSLGRLLSSENSRLRVLAASAIGVWKLESLRTDLAKLAGSPKWSDEVRIAAIQGLSQLGGEAAITTLHQIGTAEKSSEPVSVHAVKELVPLDAEAAARLAVRRWPAAQDADLQLQLVQAFLQQKGAAEILATALDGKKIPADSAKIGLRAISGSGRPEPKLTEALTKAGGIKGAAKMLSPVETQRLVSLVKDAGDPARGETIYRRQDLSCLKCHAIGGAGGKVGPDLVSLGASAQVDYLLDSLLNPNAKVKEGFHSVVVTTDAGKVITGVKVRESKTELVLRDTEDRELVIPVQSIEEQAPGTSLMPAGLADRITETELVDLVRFLSELGKVGPYAVSPTPVARKWDVLQPTEQAYYRLKRTSDTHVMADDTDLAWLPVYSTVAGSLPLDDLPTFTRTFSSSTDKLTSSFVRCRIQANSPGKARLKIHGVDGLQLWINGTPRKLADVIDLDIPQGTLAVSLAVDHDQRKDPLRLELIDSPPGVQFVTGK